MPRLLPILLTSLLTSLLATASACSTAMQPDDELPGDKNDEPGSEPDAGASMGMDAGNPVGGDAGGGGQGGGQSGELCVDLINGYRSDAGLASLARWSDAEACADGQAQADAAAGQLGSAFQQCDELGQSACYYTGPATEDEFIARCLEVMWGDGQDNPLSGTSYSKVGCGTHRDAEGTWWIVADLR